MKRIAVIGADGQLGTDLISSLRNTPHKLLPLTHKDIEITKKESIEQALKSFQPDTIINTAAYTRVDDAESDAQTCFLINTLGTKNLVDFCRNKKIVFVFYSTDYVFGQDKKRHIPYKEADTPGPINTYGISKMAGEEYIKAFLSSYFIIRTTGLFGIAGSSGKGYNFVELMLRLAKERDEVTVVADQVSSPTYTKELALQSLELLKTKKFGAYHITSQGSCSWFEFAQEIFKLTNNKVHLKPVTKKTWITPALRPHYSALGNTKIKKIGIYHMSSWKKALHLYLKEKGHI